MAKISIEEQLDQLESLIFSDAREEDLARLKKFLGAKHKRIIAKAAKLCADNHLYQFCPELKQSFHYFADKTDKDKGCFAKNAIVKTLYQLDHWDADLYTRAITTRQMEPVWGGSVDTAVELRCWGAYGLTLSPNARIILQLLELLHDPEPQARLGAVKAIANTNPTHAEMLLREKVFDGDEDAYIIGECFHQLIAIEPEHSLEFIKRFLDHHQEEWVEYSALAIAECPDPAAFDILKQAIDDCFYPTKKTHLIKAVALHRSKQALSYLLALLESVGKQQGIAIIEALSIYRSNDDIRQQVTDKITKTHQSDIAQAFEKYWNQQ